MIDRDELPIGFTFEIAQHPEILNRFSLLSEQEQMKWIEGARQIKSHEGMRNYVTSIFRP